MADAPRTGSLDGHDLRHSLSLLAYDLRLSRAELSPEPGAASDWLALLDRLEDGLASLRSLLAGGEALPRRRRPDTAALLRTLWERFERAGRLPADNCRLEIEQPLAWSGASRHWHSLVVNLLENASKAAPAGPVILSADAEGLTVSNGGAPPSAAIIAAFRRGEAGPRRGRHGRGLALILAAARALALHAELELADGLCHFRFRRFAVTAPRLLLVEDDGDLRVMLTEYLRAVGFHVEACEDGESVAPTAGRYSAVIADLGLPGRNGDALLAAWRAADAELCTVLLTGAGEAQGRHWPGVDHVILKPGLATLRELLLPFVDAGRER